MVSMKFIFILFTSILYPCLGTYNDQEEYSYAFDFERESTCESNRIYCNDSIPVSVSVSNDQRIHVNSNQNGGCITLTDVWKALESEHLIPIDPVTKRHSLIYTGTWYLNEDLYIEDGVTLNLFGTSRGGDCDELLMKSNSTGFVNLRGNGGSLNLLDTKVTSWDETTRGPDRNISDGRSYISCVSEKITDENLVCGGMATETIGECSMNISCSEISYLGYKEKGSWGISYTVNGLCSDNSNEEVFKEVGVYGNIVDTDIHDNYGCYSLGHREGNWSNNVVHDNTYGFFVNNGYKVSIEDNKVYDNSQTAVTLVESSDGFVLGNDLKDNGIGLNSKYSKYDQIKRNSISGSVSYDVFMYSGIGNKIVKNRVYIDKNNGMSFQDRKNISNFKRKMKNKFKNKLFKNKLEKRFESKGVRFEYTKDLEFSNNYFKNGIGYISATQSKNTLFKVNDQFLYGEKNSCADKESDVKVNYC